MVNKGLVVYKIVVNSYPDGECQIWAGKFNNGYGQIQINGKRDYVHRVLYKLTKGPIPAGHHIHHICGNRACINPEHFQAITAEEHQSIHTPVRQFCPHGHLKTGVKSDGRLYCKTCQRKWNAESEARISRGAR